MLERQKVSVDSPASDDVSARWRQRDTAKSSQQRPGQQDRRADLGAERGVQWLGLDTASVDPNRVRTSPFRGRPEIEQERQHGFDVADARNVVQIDGTVGQEG